MPLLCPHCKKEVPSPMVDIGGIMAQAIDKIGPDKLAAMDKVPAQLKVLKNALALVNEKLNVVAEEAFEIDLKKHPRIEAVKKAYE